MGSICLITGKIGHSNILNHYCLIPIMAQTKSTFFFGIAVTYNGYEINVNLRTHGPNHISLLSDKVHLFRYFFIRYLGHWKKLTYGNPKTERPMFSLIIAHFSSFCKHIFHSFKSDYFNQSVELKKCVYVYIHIWMRHRNFLAVLFVPMSSDVTSPMSSIWARPRSAIATKGLYFGLL